MQDSNATPPSRCLVHVCCGPCSIMPLKAMLGERVEITGFFYNPNIHPRSEFLKRVQAVKTMSRLLGVESICHEEYAPALFLRGLVASCHENKGHPPYGERCLFCYRMRLEATARCAEERGFDSFTTSLLYSKYQRHDEIRRIGVQLGERYGVRFYYADFRGLWQDGIEASKDMNLYRQKYCGCVYSRAERYANKRKKAP